MAAFTLIRLAISSFAAVLVLGIFLPGCGTAPKTSPKAIITPIDRFVALEGDGRILYEPEGEAFAKSIQRLLDDAIATVEHHHGRPFLRPVRVHVFADPRSFARESPSPDAAGVTVGGELYLSPRLAQAPEQLRGILTHELAHQHFTQYLGTRRAYEILPRWFAEGFAVAVSGAGADRVSELEATRAIGEGKQLRLSGDRQTLFASDTRSHGLKPHMFYRQSAMFVQFLKRHYGAFKFNALLNRLFGGEAFAEAFWAAFGRPVPVAWSEFVDDVQQPGKATGQRSSAVQLP